MSALATVVAADPRTDPRWARLAARPGAGLFTSPPWLRAVCDSYGFVPEARISLDDAGEPFGGFTWVTVDDPRGRRSSSLPFSDRADPLVPDLETWTTLFDAAGIEDVYRLRLLADSPVAADERLNHVGRAAWHETPLDVGVDEMHRRISSQSRRNIAASGRAGVRVDVRDDLDAIGTYHDLHVQLRKYKYDLLAQPREFFENIWREFGPAGQCVTLVASLDEQVIAAAVFLEWNGVLYYKFGASLAAHLGVRPNDAIYWRGIRYGLERGLRAVDWGLSDLDQPGLVGFKRKWASREVELLTVGTGEPAPTPQQREFGNLLGQLTGLLTDDAVPDEVSARAGALLYRYFC